MSRDINAAGLQLVCNFEGLKLEAYLCPAGVWTIGYGHTKGVKKGDSITKAEAEKILQKDLAKGVDQVLEYVKVPLTDNQLAALASFAFNAGGDSLRQSTLLKRLNAGDYDCVPSELARWVKATDPKTKQKVSLPGLVRRRAAEGELWLDNPGASDFVRSPNMPQKVQQDNPAPVWEVAARDGLRMRGGVGTTFEVVKVLPLATELRIVQEKDGWAAVDLEEDGNIDGWVSRDFLRLKTP